MSSEINILIVEDEFINRIHLKKSLIKMGYNVKGEADHVNEAIEILKEGGIDLAILDINLKEAEKDGVSIGKYIHENMNIPFIYLTAYGTEKIVKKAIATKPYSYLIKPFNQIELNASIELAIDKFQLDKEQENIKEILVKKENFFVKLETSKIDFLESKGNYLCIYALGNTYRHRSSLKKILEDLPEEKFAQTHRAYVVNTEKVEKFDKNSITIAGNKIPLSNNFKNLFFNS